MRQLDLEIDYPTLVEECRNGDRDAMSVLYTRFAPRMLHVITRYVSDRDSAHDILHDGFIAAFTRIASLRDPEQIEFWLATIMKNLSLKYLQAQTVTAILEEIPEIEEEPEIGDIIDFATLETLIRQLPEGYQKVFRLAVLEGKSHKEISEILGIAPNSSSSQLFHAKLRLRELIKDHQFRAGLISLLLLIACSGLLFLSRKAYDMPDRDYLSAGAMTEKQISRPGKTTEQPMEGSSVETSVPTVPKHSGNIRSIPSATLPEVIEDSNAEKNVTPLSSATDDSQYPIESDSVGGSSPSGNIERLPAPTPQDDFGNTCERLFADMPRKRPKDKGWSAGFSFDPGIISFNGFDGDIATNAPPANDPSGPPHGTDDDKVPDQARISPLAEDLESYLGSAPRQHHLPISFMLTAEKHLSSSLGLESGIGYSYLHSDFERNAEPTTCHWHYLEIPLKVNLYAYTAPRIKLYGSLGGRVAIPLYTYAQTAPNPYIQSGSFGSKAVWSIGGSIGASFRISKRVDIFVEPSLHYHFPQDCRIPNIWTDDEPWSISIPIGFRFSW